MSTADFEEAKLQFVDKLCLLTEEWGQPRIAGQIMGWLMICDPPHQSFSELVDRLQVSKGSVSNMTRLLLRSGLIEKVRISGERAAYFRIKTDAWVNLLEKELRAVHALRGVSGEGLELLEEEGNTDPKRLQQMHHFFSFMHRRLPSLVAEYKKEHFD